jgi:hypothetical protein
MRLPGLQMAARGIDRDEVRLVRAVHVVEEPADEDRRSRGRGQDRPHRAVGLGVPPGERAARGPNRCQPRPPMAADVHEGAAQVHPRAHLRDRVHRAVRLRRPLTQGAAGRHARRRDRGLGRGVGARRPAQAGEVAADVDRLAVRGDRERADDVVRTGVPGQEVPVGGRDRGQMAACADGAVAVDHLGELAAHVDDAVHAYDGEHAAVGGRPRRGGRRLKRRQGRRGVQDQAGERGHGQKRPAGSGHCDENSSSVPFKHVRTCQFQFVPVPGRRQPPGRGSRGRSNASGAMRGRRPSRRRPRRPPPASRPRSSRRAPRSRG